MKNKLINIIGLISVLALAGCVTLPTQEEALIQRHLARPATAVEAAVRKAALAQGFKETARNVYEQPASYPVDPIFGLVKTSDTPNSYLRVSIEVQENASGTLLRTSPCTVSANGKGKPFYWRPGTRAYELVIAIIETALAEAQFNKKPHEK